MLFRRILTLLVCTALLGCMAARAGETSGADGGTGPAAVPGDSGSGSDEAPGEGASEGEAQPARGYVLVQTATQSGWLPLPDEGEYSYPLRQVLPDGSEAENLIHLTADGVYMEDSTCENHDCIAQGTVTLENRDERILSNYIICLPNQVFLQLFTPEEVLEMLKPQSDDQP